MKIVKTSKKRIITTTDIKTYRTNTSVYFTETWVDGEARGVSAHYTSRAKNAREFWPIFLDPAAFSQEAFAEYKDYGTWIQKWERKLASIEEVEKYPCYLAYNSGHLLFDVNRKPVSIPYVFDYVGSIREKRPDDPFFRQLMDLVTHHAYFLEAKEGEIEYYNCNFSGQKALKWGKVLLPQDVYEKLYESCKNEQYFSVRMGEAMKMGWCYRRENLYGVQITELWKKWDAQKDYEKTSDDEYEGDDN
jgi:hypothetical protein